jgi:malonyl-CoA O-methyltransferase
MTALAPREAYRLWAPTYASETVVSSLDERLVASLGTPTAGRTLLDVGCGTGRRLVGGEALGIDLSFEMLAAGDAAGRCAAGDVCALPVATSSADVVWCRLVIGHVRELDLAYAELARVCRSGGTVIVSDVAADAVAAGHRRTFRDGQGTVHEVVHFTHLSNAQLAAARRVGLVLVAHRVGAIDERVRHFYADAGRLDVYEAQQGQPLVVAFAFRKPMIVGAGRGWDVYPHGP